MKWMRYIGYVISMCVIYFVMNYLYKQDTVSSDKNQNEFHYMIQIPKKIKIIYSLVFFMGIFLTLIFFFVKIKWDGGVTVGHFRFAIAMTFIGIVIMIAASKWKIEVEGEQLTVFSLGRKKREIWIHEIERAEEEDGIILYKQGKKILSVDALSENYDRLKHTLEQYGKI